MQRLLVVSQQTFPQAGRIVLPAEGIKKRKLREGTVTCMMNYSYAPQTAYCCVSVNQTDHQSYMYPYDGIKVSTARHITPLCIVM